MGKRKKKADALSDVDEAKLWELGALGTENPKFLKHRVWYVLSQQFGMRGVQEHTQMMLEDFKKILKKMKSSISNGQKVSQKHIMEVL